MANPPQGQQGLFDDTNDFNVMMFLISQALSLVAGSTLVQVVAVSTNGAVGPVGTVDVQPLVNLLDGAGTSSPHGVVYGLPFSRAQGGVSGVICDPCVGDIGMAVFADRDISTVKKTAAQANPGTLGRNTMSDGVYLFTCVSKVSPTQYVRFVQDGDGAATGMEIVDVNGNSRVTTSDGITDTDKNGNTIVMDSDGIKINGVLFDRSRNVSAVADLTTTGTYSLGGGAQALKRADGTNTTQGTAT